MPLGRSAQRSSLLFPRASVASAGSAASQRNVGRRSRTTAPLCTKWRVLQWLVLLGLLIGMGFAIHRMQQQQQEQTFKQAFQKTSDQILLDANNGIQASASLIESLALSLAASNPKNVWPMTTLEHFDVLAQNYQQQSHAAVVAYAPIVSNPSAWQDYVTRQLPDRSSITRYAFSIQDGVLVQDFSPEIAPLWQVYPQDATTATSGFSMINYNLYDIPWLQQLMLSAKTDREAKVSHIIVNLEQDLPLLFPHLVQSPLFTSDAWSIVVQPIYSTSTAGNVNVNVDNNNLNNDNSNNKPPVVGYVLALLPWGPTLFGEQRSPSEGSTLAVLQEELWNSSSTKSSTFTYHLNGKTVTYLGPGDSWLETEAYMDGSQETQQQQQQQQPSSAEGSTNEPFQRLRGRRQRRLQEQQQSAGAAATPFQVHVYPTNDYHDAFMTNAPIIFALIVVALMAFVAFWFAICQYCHDQEILEQMLVNEALNELDWVRSTRAGRQPKGLPENNKQLMRAFLDDQEQLCQGGPDRSSGPLDASSGRWSETKTNSLGNVHNQNNNNGSNGNLNNNNSEHNSHNGDLDNLSHHSSHNPSNAEVAMLPVFRDSKPVADLFPAATVLFADIRGFTPWSSVRSPAEAFCLLESLYDTWDRLAQKRRIFRVESIGDCYVAVCGLPERRSDHAVALCHYARGCLRRFKELIRLLETKLGPETSELGLRIGINSGPVMAGILRGGGSGSQARFQLFGETVSMASKIENAGAPGRIHVSKEAAAQLRDAGKAHWLQEREDRMTTKKGELVTYWLVDDLEDSPVVFNTVGHPLTTNEVGDRPEQAPGMSDDEDKLTRLVGWTCEVTMPILKMIVARRKAEKKRKVLTENPTGVAWLEKEIGSNNNVLDEVEEVISLPHYDAKVQKKIKPDNVELDERVEVQLRQYLTAIANLYHDNPFHNVQHAMHMTLSATKMLSRIVRPEAVIDKSSGKKKKQVDSELHDYTYGINSDPLTQFAVLLAALVHDVDHRGVPNNILCKEEQELAAVYDNKSVAEQNSVDIAWECLMDPRFADLRQCIYTNEAELKRFRVLLVNCVMSTDIFDKELSALRKARWEKAFQVRDDQANPEEINRKATIVIEHLIQASDVSHCMQHWHVYARWNERLYHEMYRAYRLGRSAKDPSEGWYKGEIWFFDNYVIPLAKKLNQCGVFGVSSHEYLTYAQSNRAEWEEKGQEIVEKMIEKYKALMDAEVKEREKKKVRRSRKARRQS